MIRVLLGGLGLYAGHYLRAYRDIYDKDEIRFVAAVDPYATDTPAYHLAVEQDIPIRRDFDAALDEFKPDIAFLATPINVHMEQILACFARGIHVLCEKPLAADLEEIETIRKARDESGCLLAVGFQWSFTKSMLQIKKDIADGIFGKPVHFSTSVYWQRAYTYYTMSPWKGRINNAAGVPVHDSILTNATAHYLQNMFFILGEHAKDAQVITAHAYDIETFDTCLLHGHFAGGGDFTLCVTHVGEVNENPRMTYEFEKGTITYDMDEDRLVAHMADGSVRDYGTTYSPEDTAEKEFVMVRAVRDGAPLPCSVEEVMAFSTFCEAVFDHKDHFLPFEKDHVAEVPEAANGRDMRQVPGLIALMRACTAERRFPTKEERAAAGIPEEAVFELTF